MKVDRHRMTVEEYLKLPYALDIAWDSDDEIFVARISEIPECAGHGATRSSAIEMALDNLQDWISVALENGEVIPEPKPIPDLPSGKWVQRVPRSMHAELVILAGSDGVSLNQLVVSILSKELGFRSASNRVSFEASASEDPSASRIVKMLEQIAVTESWKIDDLKKPQSINEIYIHKLVKAIPEEVKEIGFSGSYGKDDQTKWN